MRSDSKKDAEGKLPEGGTPKLSSLQELQPDAAGLRFMVDENMSPAIARSLKILGLPVYHVNDCGLAGVLDRDWLPQAGQAGIRIFTQDFKISKNKAEYDLVKRYGVGMFYFKQLKIVDTTRSILWVWQKIVDASLEPGPFQYKISSNGRFTKISWSVNCPTNCGSLAYMTTNKSRKNRYEGRCSNCGWTYKPNRTLSSTVGIP